MILTYEDSLIVREELAPLILPEEDDASAGRFILSTRSLNISYIMEW